MGGMGSGRDRHSGAKSTTDEYRKIDVRRWQREGFLTPGHTFVWSYGDRRTPAIEVQVENDHVALTCSYRKENGLWEKLSYPVLLDWTPCNLGGHRPWFICPIPKCSRRIALLYGGAVFVCRHCRDLAYACQREAYDDRSARRTNKIRERLGWQLGILNPTGGKPNGMHWRTYHRLQAQHDEFLQVALQGITVRLGLFNQMVVRVKTKLRRR